jgi:hypothetical protein
MCFPASLVIVRGLRALMVHRNNWRHNQCFFVSGPGFGAKDFFHVRAGKTIDKAGGQDIQILGYCMLRLRLPGCWTATVAPF